MLTIFAKSFFMMHDRILNTFLFHNCTKTRLEFFENFRKDKTLRMGTQNIRTCAYQGAKNVSFSENFEYVLNK